MLYKFRSAATGDLILLGPDGDALMRILGREPLPKGILEPQDLPAAIEAIQRAVKAEEELAVGVSMEPARPEPNPDAVRLRQRTQPVIEMFTRAHRAGKPIVWGV